MTDKSKDLVDILSRLSIHERGMAIVLGVKKGFLKDPEFVTEAEMYKRSKVESLDIKALEIKYPKPIDRIAALERMGHNYEAALLCDATNKHGLDHRAMVNYAKSGHFRKAFDKAQKSNQISLAKTYQSLANILGDSE